MCVSYLCAGAVVGPSKRQAYTWNRFTHSSGGLGVASSSDKVAYAYIAVIDMHAKMMHAYSSTLAVYGISFGLRLSRVTTTVFSCGPCHA